RAPRDFVRERFQIFRQWVVRPRQQMVRLERFGLREPEIGNLREHFALARDAVGHDDVERGDAVARDEEQPVAEVKNFAHLAALELFYAGQFELQDGFAL